MHNKLILFFIIIFSSSSNIFCMSNSNTDLFFKAVENDDINEIKKLLTDENDPIYINQQNKDGDTVLIIAVQKNNTNMVKELLNFFPSIDAENDHGQTALTIAITAKNTSMVNLLLNTTSELDINQKNSEGDTPLMLAIKTNNINIINAILNEVPDPSLSNDGETAESLAKKMVFMETKNEALKNLRIAQDRFNLLKIFEKDTFNLQEIVPILKKNKKNIFQVTSWKNPFLQAILKGVDSLKACFTFADIDINQPLKNGLTFLIWALLKESSDEVIEFLLEKKPNLKNIYLHSPDWGTPLLVAINKEYSAEIIKLLLEHGANANTPNKEGKTPLLEALDSKRPDFIKIIELLLEYKADVNYQSAQQHFITPLIMAIIDEKVDVVKKLLEFGADPLTKVKKHDFGISMDPTEAAFLITILDKNALEIANVMLNKTLSNGYKDIIKLLEDVIKKKSPKISVDDQMLLSSVQKFTQKLKTIQKILIR